MWDPELQYGQKITCFISCPPRWVWQESWPWCHPGEPDLWWAVGAEWAAAAAAPGTRRRRAWRAAGRGCEGEVFGSGGRWLQSPPAAGGSSARPPGRLLFRWESSAPEQELTWLPVSESQSGPGSEEKQQLNIYLSWCASLMWTIPVHLKSLCCFYKDVTHSSINISWHI